MKKLHLFMLKSFVGPFVATFFISMFVLIMQFLWRYIDDLVGKGLEGHVISELLFYVSLTLVPMGLPLAVLLASIMTFGSLGENYELTALKAAGISLYRIMKPLIVLIIIFTIAAFFFSNNVLPYANLKAADEGNGSKPGADFPPCEISRRFAPVLFRTENLCFLRSCRRSCI